MNHSLKQQKALKSTTQQARILCSLPLPFEELKRERESFKSSSEFISFRFLQYPRGLCAEFSNDSDHRRHTFSSFGGHERKKGAIKGNESRSCAAFTFDITQLRNVVCARLQSETIWISKGEFRILN